MSDLADCSLSLENDSWVSDFDMQEEFKVKSVRKSIDRGLLPTSTHPNISFYWKTLNQEASFLEVPDFVLCSTLYA
ncbi:hypothetical protein L1987_79307 [Smallanthus sonchifolius]|uniref:Uncharacterized protein n=1 Tax=Smallanthus sonchifolius TaxID=185202 RepID=A0ACB8ZJJ7_9ASTR|nr:hypothetical protein L1987_79307 [Smallanthus sonchifolius]